jgi:hypothetical protein
MARVSIQKSGSFSSGTNNEFFALSDHGDSAIVTLLYEDPDGEDIDYFVVHEAEIDGRRRYINCNAIGEDGETVNPDDCPLCQSGYPRIEKLFLQLYNHDSGKVETWDRGRSYVQKIVTFINKYGSLVTQPFEIIRSGAKGDQRTTYEFLPERPEESATLDDFPEKSELLGTLILELDEDQMFDVVDGRFTLQEERQSSRSNSRRGSSPAPRRGAGRSDSQSRTAEKTPSVSRRTPPTRGRGF